MKSSLFVALTFLLVGVFSQSVQALAQNYHHMPHRQRAHHHLQQGRHQRHKHSGDRHQHSLRGLWHHSKFRRQKTVAGNIGGHNVRFVQGRLICAINVSNWLRAHGFHSPQTRSSKAFLKYAKVAAANVHYGDVRFNYRKGGGHVMIALGNGRCLNPSSGHQTWVVKVCPAGGTYLRT